MIEKIIEKNVWDVLSETELPIILYGMGNGADMVIAELEKRGLEFADIFAGDEFVRGQLFHGKRVKKYAEICNLPNKIIDITWDDYMKSAPILMQHKGAPIHSIEPQIYQAALLAKSDGVTHLLFGENADIIFGGMDGLLAKDWTFDEFVQRYMYLDPQDILKDGKREMAPFEKYRRGNQIDFYAFICEIVPFFALSLADG